MLPEKKMIVNVRFVKREASAIRRLELMTMARLRGQWPEGGILW